MLVECKCNNCPAQLEFDSENAGQVITCPTCGMETTLFIQNTIQPEALLAQNKLEAIDSLLTVGGTDCPTCGSAQTQRLEMAFTTGISKKQGTAVGMDIQGDIGVGSYGGTSQSGLSIATKPPEKRSILGIYIAGILISIILTGISAAILMSASEKFETVSKVLGLVFLICLMVPTHKVAGTARKYNAEIYPRLFKRWKAAWICLRCGKRWIPEK